MIFFSIDRKSHVSLTSQIYSFLRESILNGTLAQMEKLPSTRELSKTLNVSRNVVIESYEQLIAEGYAYTIDGSGTYVCSGTLLQKSTKTLTTDLKLSSETAKNNSESICFRTGIPDLSQIPIKKWGQLYKDITFSLPLYQMDYQAPFGEYSLRYELSLYLNRVRGVNADPDNIIITNGAAQAFSLLCGLMGKDQYALVENPLSYGILHTLKSNNINICPISVDKLGMKTSELPDIHTKLIFMTPSHQFPTGVILPINRRIEMIQYARRHDSYIVEDDYDSEFRFNGDPIQSMQHLDPTRVIYVGTFSKTLMPALRIGYMVLPDAVCTQLKEAKYVADIHSPILEQLALQKFIETGLLSRHIKRMSKIYLQKRNHLVDCLKETFGDSVVISGADSGLHLVATFRDVCFNDNILQEIKDSGIQISSINQHYISPSSDELYNHSLIFGYGNIAIESIGPGITKLHEILTKVKFK